MPSVIILNECYHQVTRQNKCLGEAPATQHPSWEPQLVGFKRQTQSYRIKHGSVRTEVWFWLETSLHHQHIILSVLKHSVPHLLCIFDSYTKKKEGKSHLIFWALFLCIGEWGGWVDWTIQRRRAISSRLQLATFPKHSHLSIAAEFLKYRHVPQ